jgi:hypothetical protein
MSRILTGLAALVASHALCRRRYRRTGPVSLTDYSRQDWPTSARSGWTAHPLRSGPVGDLGCSLPL